MSAYDDWKCGASEPRDDGPEPQNDDAAQAACEAAFEAEDAAEELLAARPELVKTPVATMPARLERAA